MIKKTAFHPRNRHQGHYDLESLKISSPEFTAYVLKNKFGNDSIDFANPEAVRALNRALLKNYYGLQEWDIPKNSLCPPIPGRADYVHTLADLLAHRNGDVIPKGSDVRILDIGVGANCIYPLIGFHEYGWSFLATDINPLALESAQSIATKNPKFGSRVEFKLQKNASKIFDGVISEGDRFLASMCNPPFHASLAAARAGTERKWKNLGKPVDSKQEKEHVNFGGEGAELWCKGGELAFISQMIKESVSFREQCTWFTSLVFKDDHLEIIYDNLESAKVSEWHTLEMAQGQKKSRVIAWRI